MLAFGQNNEIGVFVLFSFSRDGMGWDRKGGGLGCGRRRKKERKQGHVVVTCIGQRDGVAMNIPRWVDGWWGEKGSCFLFSFFFLFLFYFKKKVCTVQSTYICMYVSVPPYGMYILRTCDVTCTFLCTCMYVCTYVQYIHT